MIRALFVLLLLDRSLYSAKATVSTKGKEVLQKGLNEAKNLWFSQAITSYEYTYSSRPCLTCQEPMTFPWTVLVHDYKIAWIHQTDSGREVKGEGVAPFTVTDFFDLIQNAIDTNHQEIQVVYDFGVGAPRRIYIDPDLNVQDDEIDISVSSYTVKSTAQRELEAAREKWDALGVVDYDYQFESSNGGTRENPAHPFPWNVSVKRAIVNRVTDANEKQVHFELENSRAMVPDSVEVMFLRIELAIAIGAFRISVTYAMEEGYPVNVLIDQKADGSEDSFMAKISFLAYELPNYRYR